MHKELHLQKNYLEGQKIETIYFGGGTPSLLSVDELNRLLEKIYELHEVANDAEITLEANPDDLTLQKVKALSTTPVNRLSIGIQSFREEDLKWMNRAHSASEADYSVKAAQDNGFENITVDLIYSIPGMDINAWKKNLTTAFKLNVQHISAYSLTIEPKTFFGTMHRKGLLKETEQEASSDQFLLMLDEMEKNGFEQYEVSNFCRQGYESRHNSSYWKGSHYLGIGPSAHSFNGSARQWNVANNSLYVQSLIENKLKHEHETLTQEMKLNEYIMTRLRTKWGIDLDFIQHEFSFDFKKIYAQEVNELISAGKMKQEEDILSLTKEGLLQADVIASDFFLTA